MALRVRFAPSPTGSLHLGGLRTALFNYLFARRHGGQFILRIEDTDQTRTVPGAAQALQDSLRWAGIVPDEGPYVQSERWGLYQDAGAELLDRGAAYRCFCTSDRLTTLREQQRAAGQPTVYDRACLAVSADEAAARAAAGEPHTVRLKVPVGSTTIVDDVRGPVKFAHSAVDDQVLLKSDGFPTYHLANVVDDHDMEISHVIRGEEWLSSTPKHALLYDAFEWSHPRFAHLPLLLNTDRSKLSKRQGDVSVDAYQQRGYLPEALVNFVALLGWNPKTTQEVFLGMDDLIQAFSMEGINKSGPVVDMTRLDWFNSKHLRLREPETLVDLVRPVVEAALGPQGAGLVDDARLVRGIKLVTEKVRETSQYGPLLAPLFAAPELPADFRPKTWDPALLVAVADALEALPEDLPGATAAIKGAAKAAGVKPGALLLPVRFAVTGLDVGADLSETLAMVGREEVCRRLRAAAASG